MTHEPSPPAPIAHIKLGDPAMPRPFERIIGSADLVIRNVPARAWLHTDGTVRFSSQSLDRKSELELAIRVRGALLRQFTALVEQRNAEDRCLIERLQSMGGSR